MLRYDAIHLIRAYGRPVQRPTQHDALIAAGLLALAQAEVWLSPETAGRRAEVALCAVAITGGLLVTYGMGCARSVRRPWLQIGVRA